METPEEFCQRQDQDTDRAGSLGKEMMLKRGVPWPQISGVLNALKVSSFFSNFVTDDKQSRHILFLISLVAFRAFLAPTGALDVKMLCISS